MIDSTRTHAESDDEDDFFDFNLDECHDFHTLCDFPLRSFEEPDDDDTSTGSNSWSSCVARPSVEKCHVWSQPELSHAQCF